MQANVKLVVNGRSHTIYFSPHFQLVHCLCLEHLEPASFLLLIPFQICCYSCAERCKVEWNACPICRSIIKNVELLQA